MSAPYRSAPEFRDETERLIWCTAFATHELRHEGRAHPFDKTRSYNERDFDGNPVILEWCELAHKYANGVLDGYRKVFP